MEDYRVQYEIWHWIFWFWGVWRDWTGTVQTFIGCKNKEPTDKIRHPSWFGSDCPFLGLPHISDLYLGFRSDCISFSVSHLFLFWLLNKYTLMLPIKYIYFMSTLHYTIWPSSEFSVWTFFLCISKPQKNFFLGKK